MELLKILKNFKNKKVLVIGDLILDCFVWGRVSRISPEAPVPVVDVDKKTYVLGGAANVAANIVSLGGQATISGIIGGDLAAQRMFALFSTHGIDNATIQDSRPTTIKTRVIAHGQQVVRFDHEDRNKIEGSTLKAFLKNVKDLVSQHDAVIISDYKKGVITRELIKAVLSTSAGKFVALDPKVGHFHLYKGVSLITPNKNEASQGSGIDIVDTASLYKAGSKLMKMTGGSVLITRGEDGMSLFEKGSVTHIPTVAKKVFDVTGAGDTVIATFTLAYASGATMCEAAAISNIAGGIVVGEVGTAQVSETRLRQSIKSTKLTMEKDSI